jgi:hypothetical protein
MISFNSIVREREKYGLSVEIWRERGLEIRWGAEELDVADSRVIDKQKNIRRGSKNS